MIQLYEPSNTDFIHNGNYTLHPESCELTMETNGSWEIQLEHPIDDEGNFSKIVEQAVIASPTPYSDKQLFRIYHKTKTDDGVTAYARPIFFDAAHDVYIVDKRPTNATGQQALNVLTDGTKYSGESNIVDIHTSYIQNNNLVEALFSDNENSFLKRWGGEPIFDNFKVIVDKQCGGDYGLHVTFGRNLLGIEEDVNMDDVVTRIYPQAYNGYTLPENGYVDSPLINHYPIIYCKHIEYSDIKLQSDCSDGEDGFDNLEELYAALIERCNKEFQNGIDKPTINYEVDMQNLSETEEYKEFKCLETVGLGDRAYCYHKRLDIETTARVIKIVFDCIKSVPKTLTLGDVQSDYFDKLNSTMQTAMNAFDTQGNVKGQSIAGVIDMMQAVLKASRGIAKKQKERAILFEDLDPDSDSFGATALGTTGFCISNKRSADGKDWVWSTIGTGAGFLADMLIGGLLISKNYDEVKKQGVKFDLDAGFLKAFNFSWEALYSSLSSDGKLRLKTLELDMEDPNPNQKIIHCSCGDKEFTVTPNGLSFESHDTGEYLYINPYGSSAGDTRGQIYALSPTSGYSGPINGQMGTSGFFYSKNDNKVTVKGGIITSIGE